MSRKLTGVVVFTLTLALSGCTVQQLDQDISEVGRETTTQPVVVLTTFEQRDSVLTEAIQHLEDLKHTNSGLSNPDAVLSRLGTNRFSLENQYRERMEELINELLQVTDPITKE
ncbi:hypothetical protein COU49_02760 [Candidatus Nomurabacteria bacterium CG10_big_fil_rev_8_21_14_0_10_35_16]|uniref:Uncharacterized protein n=1 Tax=Candidatus Nomurabacteria bacterium CG10_big_fil_rev_8_21_14_0_10_35_16 TaxID=1974731 RepID=A0A2H0TCS4_9BACT|nr:MAG: hypothetical protein COU49_02760 [Candidatus Nomurabacteria bacterium CG10_big_fil_rev_8_21_14_0_10_35_16]